MKHQIIQILNRKIVADDTMAKLVRIMCIVASLFVLSLSLWKLLRLDLTESQLFFGVLVAPITPMLLIILGLVLPGAVAHKSNADKTDAGNGSYGICRVIDASRSPSPNPGRSVVDPVG